MDMWVPKHEALSLKGEFQVSVRAMINAPYEKPSIYDHTLILQLRRTRIIKENHNCTLDLWGAHQIRLRVGKGY